MGTPETKIAQLNRALLRGQLQSTTTQALNLNPCKLPHRHLDEHVAVLYNGFPWVVEKVLPKYDHLTGAGRKVSI